MSEVPIQLIVAAFQDEKAADNALKELKSAQRQHLIDIQDAAVIRRDEKNKLHIKETADPGGGKGAAAGGAIGAVIGLIGGPAGVVVGAAVGAAVGGVTAKVIDSGIPARMVHIQWPPSGVRTMLVALTGDNALPLDTASKSRSCSSSRSCGTTGSERSSSSCPGSGSAGGPSLLACSVCIASASVEFQS